MKWLMGVLLVASGQLYAADSARQWLNDMTSALQSLDYDGTFVYLHDDRMDAMRIIRRAEAGGQKERLVSLTGSAREVLRDDRSVTCIMPDNRSVMIGKSKPRQPFPVLPQDLDNLSRYYRLQDVGDDRMAGYNARVIAIRPRDNLRYGYRFWIDKESRMLLKSDLSDVDGRPIEQVMFTQLKVGGDIPAAELQPSLSGEGFVWKRQADPARPPLPDGGESTWHAGWLPSGFELTGFERKRIHEKSGEAAEHLIYSDGIATVSVYVEKNVPADRGLQGLSSMGATHAYGIRSGDHQVTVVGEVPAATVEKIAGSVGARDGT